jgi:hypothetical protein
MTALHHIRGGATALPLDAMLATIPSLPRPILSRLVARMIERMDEIDPDSDIEDNGDELDGSMAEDDFHSQDASWLGFPGCPIGDPPEDDSEDCCAAMDDGCGWRWVNGRQVWGSADEQTPREKPRYGIDQARGPNPIH